MPAPHNSFEDALAQLSRATRVRAFDEHLLTRLATAEREVRVSIPVTMDDGQLKTFEGYRVQHSSVRGPYKGGVRFHPQADMNEVNALAFWMTLKTAVIDVPLGGGKGGVTVDSKTLSARETEALARGWVRMLAPVLGPHMDIPAPDMNTNAQVMDWMADEYAQITGDSSNAAFTGKSIPAGGSEGRVTATALGGFFVFDALREHLGVSEGATVAVQGMGNVGGNVARIFHERGYKVVAMSDSKSAVYAADGLDPAAVEAHKKEHGTLEGLDGAEVITNRDLLTLPVEVLVPAALENQITDENAAQIQARVVLELANGPTTPGADDILFERGTYVIPDILANAGGVFVSYCEWQQNLNGEHWTQEVVETQLEQHMKDAARAVWGRAQEYKTDLRRAAFIAALERLEEACRK